MRVPLVILLVLAAGCLESGTEPGSGEPTPATSSPPAPTPVSPTSMTTTSPVASPTPTPTPTPPPTPTATPPTPPGPTRLAITQLAFGAFASSGTAERAVITDQAAYEAFWIRVREDPQKSAPPVDFTRSTAIGVVEGPRSDTCWAVRVTDAVANGDGPTSVEITTYTPPPDTMCGMAITYPWHLVAIEGAGRTVTFTNVQKPGPSPTS